MAALLIAPTAAFPSFLAGLAVFTACGASEQTAAPSNPSPVTVVQVCDSALVPVGPDSTMTCPSGATRTLGPAP